MVPPKAMSKAIASAHDGPAKWRSELKPDFHGIQGMNAVTVGVTKSL